MDTYKRIIKENSLLYGLLIFSFGIESVIQLLVYPFQTEGEKIFTYFFQPLLFFLICAFINGIILPLTSYRFSVLFTGNREKAYNSINAFMNFNLFIFMVLTIMLVFLAPFNLEAVQKYTQTFNVLGNSRVNIIALELVALYTAGQVGLYISYVFLNKGIIRGLLNVLFAITLFTLIILGSVYFDTLKNIVFWLVTGFVISLLCRVQNNQHFRGCEF